MAHDTECRECGESHEPTNACRTAEEILAEIDAQLDPDWARKHARMVAESAARRDSRLML